MYPGMAIITCSGPFTGCYEVKVLVDSGSGVYAAPVGLRALQHSPAAEVQRRGTKFSIRDEIATYTGNTADEECEWEPCGIYNLEGFQFGVLFSRKAARPSAEFCPFISLSKYSSCTTRNDCSILAVSQVCLSAARVMIIPSGDIAPIFFAISSVSARTVSDDLAMLWIKRNSSASFAETRLPVRAMSLAAGIPTMRTRRGNPPP